MLPLPAREKVLAVILGIAVVIAALAIAVLAVGPTLRAIIGQPPGYGSDVTSHRAYLQAIIAQLLCVAFAFLIFGVVFGRRAGLQGWRRALWAANPLTVGFAYWVFRHIASANWPYEYKAVHGWLVLTIIAPVLLAPCASLGASLGFGQLLRNGATERGSR